MRASNVGGARSEPASSVVPSLPEGESYEKLAAQGASEETIGKLIRAQHKDTTWKGGNPNEPGVRTATIFVLVDAC